MILFTLALTAAHFVSFFLASAANSFAFSALTSEWPRLNHDTKGAEAVRDTPEDPLLKRVFTAKSRLGSGGRKQVLSL